MYVCSVAQSCLSLWDSIDCSPPSSSVCGIFQVRILEWISISFSRGSSQPSYWVHISCIGRWILYPLSYYLSRGSPWIIIEIKCRIDVMCLNHPETNPSPVHGKIVFRESGPWCQKGWGPLPFSTKLAKQCANGICQQLLKMLSNLLKFSVRKKVNWWTTNFSFLLKICFLLHCFVLLSLFEFWCGKDVKRPTNVLSHFVNEENKLPSTVLIHIRATTWRPDALLISIFVFWTTPKSLFYSYYKTWYV